MRKAPIPFDVPRGERAKKARHKWFYSKANSWMRKPLPETKVKEDRFEVFKRIMAM